MKSFKYMLAGATALGLVMAASAAFADSNNGDVYQNGDNNKASVTQSGTGNQAGAGVGGINFNHAHLKQNGDNNELTIEQTGNQNSIATAGEINTPDPKDVIQQGNLNSATIDQFGGTASGRGNALGAVFQNNNSNKLNITEKATSTSGYVQNSIGEITQGTVGGSNQLTITQTQVGAVFGTGNTVEGVVQEGPSDIGSITQTGNLNLVGSLKQTGGSNDSATIQQGTGTGNLVSSLTQNGSNDSATVKLLGNYNGADSAVTQHVEGAIYGNGFAAKAFTLGSAAASVVNVTPSVVTQDGGNHNVLSYTATGDNNAYGFNQLGSSNTITGSASVGSNEAAVSEIGSTNSVNFVQSGTGSNNLGVSIFGSNNNAGAHFSGDAATVGLTPGNLFQEVGSGNSIKLTVGSGMTDSNNNLFAVTQAGSNNTVVGSIGGGNGNQVAIAQIGSSNSFLATQNGGGNNLAVRQ